MAVEKGTYIVKKGLAQMLKGGVIMDVVTAEQARIAEEAGPCAANVSTSARPAPAAAVERAMALG